jgi:hypothetical protein
MKTKLRIGTHFVTEGEPVVELWWEDQLIGCVYGSESPGIRLVSKFPVSKVDCSGADWTLHRIETRPGTQVTEIHLELNPPERT